MSAARSVLLAGVLLAVAVPVAAQPARRRPWTERGFISLNAGAQTAAGDLEDHVLFEANAETGSIDTRYPGRTGVLVDAGAGIRLRGRLGVAVTGSRAESTTSATVAALVPHPFFDDRHRSVEGTTGDINRTETAIAAQLYYELEPARRWRLRLLAGPAYLRVQQALVTDVGVDETFPYDTAQFRGATTQRATGSGIGFSGALDISRLLSRRVGAGALVRYTSARIDLNAPESRTVSTDGGGLQAGVGLRILF